MAPWFSNRYERQVSDNTASQAEGQTGIDERSPGFKARLHEATQPCWEVASWKGLIMQGWQERVETAEQVGGRGQMTGAAVRESK